LIETISAISIEMSNDKERTVRVAAVQMESKNGLIDDNLDHATPLVERAAQDGARLIVLPEFMPTGYIFTRDIWNGAETKEGPTVRWLKENSKRLGVWLGTSFLEADGEDFFNTFVLATPDGEEAGRVRKQTPAAYEAYFFRGDTGPHVIDTELGKIGVGICYENYLSYIPQMMQQQSVDLLLMPLSAPTPMQNFFFRHSQTEYYNSVIKEGARRMACLLGVPVIMVNKCGRWRSPMPGMPFWKQDSSFPGLSNIVDSDGTVKAQLGDEEVVIVEDVTLDPSCKTHEPPQCCGRWAWEGHWIRNYLRVIETFGGLRYTLSSERKKRARGISSATNSIDTADR
jgi:N-carbamoylputrescine amidase